MSKRRKKLEVKHVFIGSPGDVADERKIFREVIDRVNQTFAEWQDVQLKPLGWEDTLPLC